MATKKFTDKHSAAVYLRDCYEKHQENITFDIELKGLSKDKGDAACREIYDAALLLPNVALGDELEALFRWNRVDVTKSSVSGGVYYGHYDYSTGYATTLAQQKKQTTALTKLLKQLDVEGKSAYMKCKKIYDWIHQNITFTGQKEGQGLTPYDTFFDRKGICQGYSTLFCKMGAMCGLDCKYVRGDEHAWNLVKVSGQWYIVDSMWGYFMLGSKSIKKDDECHVMWDKFKKFATPAADDYDPNICPVYRLYNPNSGEHFYTRSEREKLVLSHAGWTYEGIGWQFSERLGTPVWRLYAPAGNQHFYTASETERKSLVDAGWTYEGVCWRTAIDEEVPIYRLKKGKALMLTASVGEKNTLVKAGWTNEGVRMYGLK